jgi:hypothetical protein
MVCALMASYVLESSECGNSGQILTRAWRVPIDEIVSDQAGSTIIKGCIR